MIKYLAAPFSIVGPLRLEHYGYYTDGATAAYISIDGWRPTCADYPLVDADPRALF